MTQLEPEEIESLAKTDSNVAHCPESNLKLASGIAPVAAMDAHGINCCIGTDGAASNDDLDMISELRTAALLAKGSSGDAAVLPAPRVLSMATLNGARALGLDSVTGSLRVGKWADVAAVNLKAPETWPVYNPLTQIVYAAGREQVTDVWVAGRRLLKNRQLTQLDETDVLEHAYRWKAKLANVGPLRP
jgi:5-methylthioadenosine/S-adenosylhomocysteine deaminase